MSGSPSKTPIRISIPGLGDVKGELIRFTAPLTVEALLRRLPLEGRAHPCDGGYSFIVGIKRGEEKAVKEVRAGAIAYWPMGDALCLFHSDTQTYSPVNRVGRVTEKLKLIERITSGARIRIESI